MIQRTFRFGGTVLGVLFILSASAFAQLNISQTPGAPSVSPRVVTDSQGNVHSVWVEKTTYLPGTSLLAGDVYYAKADWATQQISTPVNLSNSGTVYSDTDEMSSIAVDGSGRIYVVWTEGWDPTCLLKVRILSNGSWGAAYTVQSGLRFRTPRIAVTSDGDIYLAWWDFQWKIQSTARIGGTWETVRMISSSSEIAKMADIDVGPNIVGVVFIKKPSSYDVYQASYIQRGKGLNAAWSAVTIVAPDPYDQVFTAIRIDSNDVPHIAWMDDSGNRVVQYSYRTSTGGFAAPLALTGWSLYHSLFLSKRGDDIYFAWQLGGYGNGVGLQYDVRYANGSWRGVRQVPNSAGVTYGDIAASPDKSILYFVWDTNFYGNGDIYGWAETIATPGKRDFIGTWNGQGVYALNSDTGAWTYLTTPATVIAAGDLDGDGIDDLVGVWPNQSGVWVKYSKTGTWTLLTSLTARQIAVGDMNGDGNKELVGTWDGQGVFYLKSSGDWVMLATPATQIAVGDLDGDGTDDLIGIWPGQGGVWVNYSKTGQWALLSASAKDIATGDMNGDGRVDFVGTWDGQGVFFRNSLTGQWVQMAAIADQVTAGDLDGDGTADLVGIWPAQGGVWAKYSKTGTWARLSSTAADIATGRLRVTGASSFAAGQGLNAPLGGFGGGPSRTGNFQDRSAEGPGGRSFVFQIGPNLVPLENGDGTMRIPGPGESGFSFVEQKNLVPSETSTAKKK
jgi:hypothetical protein